MKLYSSLSRGVLFKRYSSKFLAIAFLGIHIPLIGLIVFLSFNKDVLATSTVLLITLIFTLGATAVTLTILNKLLAPIKLASHTLKSYLESQKIPNLPTEFKDEVGELLRDLQYSIEVFDNLIESKQQTIAILSHDLRNQCSGIVLSLDLLLDSDDKEEKLELVNTIKSLAADQLSLMENTLANLKNETKTQGKLEKQKIDLQKVIKEVIDSYRIASKKKELHLIFEAKTNLELYANETALRQVFTNLISNAIKFSQPGDEIWIKATKNQSVISVQVIDNGMGFKDETAESLFKPFTEHSRSGSQGEVSNGMGLFLSRRFVNKHFGKLTAHSEGINQGATFTVVLPFK